MYVPTASSFTQVGQVFPQPSWAQQRAVLKMAEEKKKWRKRKWYEQQMQRYSWPREVNFFTHSFTPCSVPLWMKYWSSRQKHLNPGELHRQEFHWRSLILITHSKFTRFLRVKKKDKKTLNPKRNQKSTAGFFLAGLLITMGEFWFYLDSRPAFAFLTCSKKQIFLEHVRKLLYILGRYLEVAKYL